MREKTKPKFKGTPSQVTFAGKTMYLNSMEKWIILDEEICAVIDTASFFEQQGYYKTAAGIVSLAKAVDKKQISSAKRIIEKVLCIRNVFADEFLQSAPKDIATAILQELHKLKIQTIITTTMPVDPSDFPEALIWSV